MKKAILAFALGFVTCDSFAQNGTYTNLTVNSTFTKQNGAADLSGWGLAVDNTLDPRPNYLPGIVPYMFNNHTGLTFSAHSAYGGIRFYNQGYPGTYSTVNGASLVMSITNGNVGISTTTPAAYLHIAGAEYIPGTSGSAQNSNLRIGASTTNLVLDAGIATSGNPTPYSWLQSRNQATYAANYDLALNPNGGNVGIGTIDTKGYKLAVNGSAVATSMKVKMQVNWPDFVFLKDYKLPTLTEVKNYIDKNQHLPDIPSADEVHKNGLDLGEMNRLLLKKVEELTLYLIGQKEETDKLRAEVGRQNQCIADLEKALVKADK